MKRWLRPGLVVLALVAIYVVGRVTGLNEQFSIDSVREAMQGTGWWGFVVFIGIFCTGLLFGIPGIVFLFAAVLVYGKLWGAAASILAGIIGMTISFVVVRRLGGQPFKDITRPFLRKWLDRVDQRPIRSIIVIRLVMMAFPAVNYALAMSSVKFRDYFIGSSIGLVPPFSLYAVFFEWTFKLMS